MADSDLFKVKVIARYFSLSPEKGLTLDANDVKMTCYTSKSVLAVLTAPSSKCVTSSKKKKKKG